MRRFGILICVGILGLIVSDAIAKKQIRNDFTGRRQYIANSQTDFNSIITSSRVTGNTTLTASHYNVNVNTDSAGVTITLPAGVAGTMYRVVNTGSSSNNVTITPNGSEHILGVNSNWTLFDGESLIMAFDSSDGWY